MNSSRFDTGRVALVIFFAGLGAATASAVYAGGFLAISKPVAAPSMAKVVAPSATSQRSAATSPTTPSTSAQAAPSNTTTYVPCSQRETIAQMKARISASTSDTIVVTEKKKGLLGSIGTFATKHAATIGGVATALASQNTCKALAKNNADAYTACMAAAVVAGAAIGNSIQQGLSERDANLSIKASQEALKTGQPQRITLRDSKSVQTDMICEIGAPNRQVTLHFEPEKFSSLTDNTKIGVAGIPLVTKEPTPVRATATADGPALQSLSAGQHVLAVGSAIGNDGWVMLSKDGVVLGFAAVDTLAIPEVPAAQRALPKTVPRGRRAVTLNTNQCLRTDTERSDPKSGILSDSSIACMNGPDLFVLL